MYQLTCFPDVVMRSADRTFVQAPEPGGISYGWEDYQAWLAEGNTPLPAPQPPAPPALTPEQKLQQAGLTVDELRALLAAPDPHAGAGQ